MKKKIVVLLTAGVCMLSLFGGCGSDAKKDDIKGKGGSEYKVEEQVTLGKYKGMEITLSDYSVTDETVKEYVESMLPQYPAYKKTKKTTVENGDFVNIDYEGKKDDVAFEGGAAANSVLEIGSNSFIEGFEEGLIGKKVGEETDLNLTFPEDYQNNPELAGADVVFNVKINSIVKEKAVTFDEMTDGYVEENLGFESVQELLDKTKENLENEGAYYEQQEKQSVIIEKLKEECTVEFPEGLVDQRVKEYKEEFKQYQEENGSTIEDYLKENELTEEEYDAQVIENLTDNLIMEFISEAIAKEEGIEIEEEEYKEYIEGIISYFGFESEEALYESYGEDYMKSNYIYSQVLEFVAENAVVSRANSEETKEDNAEADEEETKEKTEEDTQ